MPLPPRRTLRSPDDIVANRKAMWADWIDECEGIRDTFIEGLLTNLSSAKRDG